MTKEDVARRKLVDWLGTRKDDGPLRAMVATTYEFQQEFFETDFLPNLLDLGAWKERHWTSRIALERHLANLKAAAVFIDSSCYRGRPDSLRVSINPVALGRGRSLHAKVLLLVYEDAVRLVLGSANLTENGYRKNREGVATLRAGPASTAQAALIQQGIVGLRDLISPWSGCGALPILDEVEARLAIWISKAQEATPSTDRLIWSGPQVPLWQAFAAAWPQDQSVRRISIVSPFWSEEGTRGPLTTLISKLRERAPLARDAEVHLLTEAWQVSRKEFIPILPEAFATFDARTLGVRAFVSPVDPRVDRREVEVEDFEGLRALHAKAVLVEGDTNTLAYIGSANFTRRGWGFSNTGAGEAANVEAGIILQRATSSGIRNTLLPPTIGRPIPLEGAALGKFQNATTEMTEQPWPAFITEITLAPRMTDVHELELRVTCDTSTESQTWSIQLLGDPVMLSALLYVRERADSSPISVSLSAAALEQILRERELEVVWDSPSRTCRFPVNVDPSARDGLPVAPGDGRPSESGLLAYYQGRIAWEELFPEPGATRTTEGPGAVDMQMVDTTRIQSYQIREFVEALRGIRDDLRGAGQSGTSVGLALRGPVSPVALAHMVDDVVRRKERTPVAGCFQLVEILVILGEATSFAGPKYQDEWLACLAAARQEVEQILVRLKVQHPDSFGNGSVFSRYERAIRRPTSATDEPPA